jgi:uncharacterized protein with von Willebrand factor type A (vWA) domain
MRALDPKDKGMLDNQVAYSPYAVDNDAFDIREFESIKEHSPNLLKSQARGEAEYEQFPELQQDIYDALYKYEPVMHEDWEMKREFLLNQKIAAGLMETPKYKELRVLTQLDTINSVVGVELMSDETIDMVKTMKKEREALQEVVDAGKALDDAQAGDGKGKSNDDDAITLEEAKERYEKAMETFNEATSREEFKHELNRLAAKVRDSVKETSDLISNWGLEASGSYQKRSAHEKMAMLNRLRNSSKLKKIAQMVGKFRRLAQLHRKEKVKQGLDETYGIQQGSNIAQLVSSEILRFLIPETEEQFMSDLIEGKTLIYQIRGKQKKGKGPIIICIDSSGSMEGVPEIWSKAVAMVLLEIAREQKRDFYCIHFSSGYRELHTNEFLKADPWDIEKVIDMAEYFECGGTEFEPPLNLARQKIGVDKLYLKADIVFVTDGESAVRDNWLVEFKNWKKENKVNIYSVLIDSYANSNATINQFSDRVDKLSNLREGQESIALDLFLDM